ncbi:MAG: B12-binding domain-containing radical SAM protein [Candidatus Thorarchaeota archaeon]
MSKTRLREHNVVVKDLRDVSILVGYCYPSTYRAGMTGLATHLFYALLNTRADVSCERYFRYDVPSAVQSLETSRPLPDNHIVAFSLTWEEDIINLIQMLELGSIAVEAKDRTEESPIVLVGGPVVSSNPEPYVDFVDAFVIGEGDLVIHDIIDAVRDSPSRSNALEGLSEIPGVYVPTAEPSSVVRIIIEDLDSLAYPTSQIIPDVLEGSQLEPVFGKSFLTEVTRGCGHSCKFCLIGYICPPRRTRSLDRLKEIIAQGLEASPVNKVSLIGSSLGDHDGLEDLANWIVKRGVELSAPSLRADSVTVNLLRAFVNGGQRTLTIAPEAGSPELRKVMGKGLDDEDIHRAVKMAKDAGYKAVKLYFIIGLPNESQQDILAIVQMVKQLAQTYGLRTTASVNPFVPKAHTRWEGEPQSTVESLRQKLKLIETGVRNVPKVTVEGVDPRNARIQAALSVGDRSIGKVIQLAAKYGGLGGWRRAEKESGISFFSVANNPRYVDGKVPWAFMSS